MSLPYQLISLPKIIDERGNLSFFENEQHIPFVIKRVYWLYDVPGGEKRGGHSYKTNQEFIVALSGSFDVVLHDGAQEYRVSLNRSYNGIVVPNGIWRQLENFSTNSLALIAASTDYDASDYIRDFETFIKSKTQ